MTANRYYLAVVVILMLDVIRWSLLIWYGQISLVADAAQYWQLGQSVAEGDWLLRSHAIAYRTPGYPWFLGIIMNLVPGCTPRTVAIFQGLLLSGTTYLTGAIILKITASRTASLLAMFTSLFFLARAAWVCTILTETLFTFMLVLHVGCAVCWLRTVREPAGRQIWFWPAAVGLSYALLVLVRPIATYLILVHGVALALAWWFNPRAKGTGRASPLSVRMLVPSALQMGLFLVCLILPLTPWLARNQAMFGRAKLTEFLGRNVWIVTYQAGAGAALPLPTSAASKELLTRIQQATESHGDELQQVPVDVTRTWQVSEALTFSGLADPAADRLMRQVAWQSICQEPVRWLERAARRFVNFYRCVADDLPVLGNAWLNHYLGWTSLCMLVVLAASLAGLVVPVQRVWVLWLGGIVIYFGAVTALVEIPDYRYRLVLEPLFVILVILGIQPWLTPNGNHFVPERREPS